MQETVFNAKQKTAIKLEISLEELLLIQYLTKSHVLGDKNVKHIIVDDKLYSTLSFSDIQRDLPILRYTESDFFNIINNLITKEILEDIEQNNIHYFAVSEIALSKLY